MKLDGLLIIDKPTGITSRDAVNRVQGWLPRRTRVGHAGTLDPMATGVLVVCVGQATRLTEYIQRMDKEYQAGVVLGATSDTDDADGTVTVREVSAVPTREQVLAEIARFIGNVEQVPPAYSAAKVTGRRAYDLARRGKAVDLKPRPVRIDAIDVLGFAYPRLEITVRCGKGTYIRALARDLGQRLGCGAYLESLRRTRIGPFAVENAISLNLDATEARRKLLGIEWAVHGMPTISLSATEIADLRQGRAVSPSSNPGDIPQEEIAVFDESKNLAAIVRWEAGMRALQPVKVLTASQDSGR